MRRPIRRFRLRAIRGGRRSVRSSSQGSRLVVLRVGLAACSLGMAAALSPGAGAAGAETGAIAASATEEAAQPTRSASPPARPAFESEGEGDGGVSPRVTRWKWTTGFDFSRGDFGLDEDTTLYFVPLGVTADHRRWRFNLVLPLLVNDGPNQVIPGGGAGGRSTTSGVSAGLGQIQSRVSHLFPPALEGLPYFEMTGKVVFPTETDDDLGTGVWAFGLQADVFREFGRLTPFASFGRKFYTGSRLEDRFHASVGGSLEISSGLSLGLAYDWIEASVSGVDDAHELVPYLSLRMGERWRFGPYAVVGLSEGAPDYGFGWTIAYRP